MQRFPKDGVAVNPNGVKMAWIMADAKTLLVQSHETGTIYVWQFDERLRRAASHSYKRSSQKPTAMNLLR